MATGLQNQYAAAQDPTLYGKVAIAIMVEAYTVYTEATTTTAVLPQAAITALPITPALTAALASGTTVMVGDNDVFTLSATANIGATSLAVTGTASRGWPMGTAVSPPTPQGHTARAGLANRILQEPTSFSQRFEYACAAQGIDNTSSDATIQGGVVLVWNLIAGA